jgi:AraC-like DNA-binding protein
MASSTQLQAPPVSRPMHRQEEAEKTGGPARLRSSLLRPAIRTEIHPLLAHIVEEITDWDFPDGDVVRILRTRALPGPAPHLIVQYRAPMRTDRYFGSTGYPLQRYYHAATVVRTGVIKLGAIGPVGVLLIRLKPEASSRLIGEPMHEFFDAKIDLRNIFNAGAVSLLEEMLREAPDSAARFACIESFLLQNLRECQSDPVVCRAAECLRRNPALRMRRLAAQLEVSERHLLRGFRAMFGTGPKQFARLARIERIQVMRQGGSAWADIAYACGFADQAHMINDFEAFVGEPPQQIFGTCPVNPDRDGSASPGPDFFGRYLYGIR